MTLRPTALLVLLLATALPGADPALPWTGTFANDQRPAYNEADGFGFVPMSDQPDAGKPQGLRFDINVKPGNYRVDMVLHGGATATPVTILAEMRRLMVHARTIPAGGDATLSFAVNTRVPQIDGGGAVMLNEREKTGEMIVWDGKLTVMVLGRDLHLTALTVTPITVPTIYLAGDSTVCDQGRDPFASWGQMLTRFFGPGVAIANHAQSGTSVASSLKQKRIAKILSQIRPGDHLFIQFGHNDMKAHDPDRLDHYRKDLLDIIAQVKAKGGTTTLVTSMERHRFEQGRSQDTLAGYPQAMLDVAKETGTPCIDLHSLSMTVYDALGEKAAADLFALPPGQSRFDHTHHASIGAYVMAQCIVHGIQTIRHPLATQLATDLPAFDPAKPDLGAIPAFPLSSVQTRTKPLGD